MDVDHTWKVVSIGWRLERGGADRTANAVPTGIRNRLPVGRRSAVQTGRLGGWNPGEMVRLRVKVKVKVKGNVNVSVKILCGSMWQDPNLRLLWRHAAAAGVWPCPCKTTLPLWDPFDWGEEKVGE